MITISELVNEINKLPKGDIYPKVINNKTYFYYQFFDNGKRVTRLVKGEELNELKDKILYRKTLESKLHELSNLDKRLVSLSNHAKNLTGQLMSEDVPIANFNNGVMTSCDEKMLPLVVKRTYSLESFLKLRVIDSTRVNSRILKKALNIHEISETIIPLYTYALSLTDDYWFKPKNSKLKYNDVQFKNDSMFDIALKGDTSYFPRKTKVTPELTTTGSYEKGWKKIDDEWWLYKQGTDLEIFSEIFCSSFAKLINIPTVTYEYDNGFIRSKNFASRYNFEPMCSLVANDDRYETVFPVLLSINKDIARQYIKLMCFDAVVNNVDRHNENYGLLRNRRNGDIISLAPNFDNNIALISRTGSLIDNPHKDGLIKILADFLQNNSDAYDLYKEILWPEIAIKDINDLINVIPIRIDEKDRLAKAIINRYNFIKAI